jgi:preprotein translocase subunit SecY
MVSAVEQLSKNANWGAFSKATELKQRIMFVLGAILVYRLGSYIPVPGIDPLAWSQVFAQKGGGILDMFNLFSGGALERMTIFALNIMPYISASIIVQLATSLVPQLESLKKEGEQGRVKINQYTRFLTVFLAAIQAYGLAVGLENIPAGEAGSPVIDPGMFFRISTVITIVGGTVFLMWLGDQITRRGIGNGISLIIFAGIVAQLPRAFGATLELGRQGQFSMVMLLVIAVLILAVITFIVFMERAQRRIVIQYPKRQAGNRMMQADSNHIPLKLNISGVIPPIFASSLLMLPTTIFAFGGLAGTDWEVFLGHFRHGQPAFMLAYALLISFFCFFYTAIVFNPEENAEMLRRNGGFIPGIRPGKSTADYFDYVMTRITVLGAAYLVFICLLPEFLIAKFAMPFSFGGTSLLIVVSVTMDTVGQIQSHMIAHQYEGLIRKAKLKGKM